MYSEEPVTAMSIRKMACGAAFGQSLITNNFRGLVAEAIVASALAAHWQWCSKDWAGWDLERADGLRLEVKQSASRQTWARSDNRPSSCRFDIRAREGRYAGAEWIPGRGHNAELFVMAHHFVCDESTDHCAPNQWRFFVVPTLMLPPTKTIGLSRLEKLVTACSYAALPETVSASAAELIQAKARQNDVEHILEATPRN